MAETRIQEMRATESARRGAKVLLLCAEGSTEEYIEPLYDPSYAVKRTVKDEDAFVKLSRQLLSATVGHYKKEEGRSSEISTFVEPIGVILRELFKNTHDWARTDINNVDITNSVRGIRFEVYQSPLAAFQNHVGRSPVLHEYVSTLRAEPRYLRVLEVSVFDSGPGLVERFLGRGIHEGFSLQEEYTTLLKCLELLWFANNPSAMVLTLLSVHKDVRRRVAGFGRSRHVA